MGKTYTNFNYEFGISKEAIKAIRLCCGYTTDIRFKFSRNSWPTAFEKVENFLDENGVAIFGTTFCLLKHTDPDFRLDKIRYFELLRRMADTILT